MFYYDACEQYGAIPVAQANPGPALMVGSYFRWARVSAERSEGYMYVKDEISWPWAQGLGQTLARAWAQGQHTRL